MYLQNLISIVRRYPSITDTTVSAVDDYLGTIGQNGIFSITTLLSAIPQRKMLEPIIGFLRSENIIVPYSQKCNVCGKEDQYPMEECENCNTKLDVEDTIYYYKLIAPINLSDAERQQMAEKRQRLLLSTFRILLAKIDRKIRREEDASIILLDLAESTELSRVDPYFCNLLKKEFIQLVKDVSTNFLKRTEGHFIKADGDSAFVFLEDTKAARKFMLDFCEMLFQQQFFERMRQRLEGDDEIKPFIKIYHASSKILEYQKPDILTLDFTGMEAFTINNRVEKPAKKAILSRYSLRDFFPFYLLSNTDMGFEQKKNIKINDVQNFGDLDMFLYFPSDIK